MLQSTIDYNVLYKSVAGAILPSATRRAIIANSMVGLKQLYCHDITILKAGERESRGLSRGWGI